MKKPVHIVQSVTEGSIAMEMGIEPGDRLLSINGQEIEDVFDYHFLADDEEIVLLIEKPFGEQWELEIEKDAQEDLGIVFEQNLMDEYRSCRNKCMFCFIDQMPKGMRSTLYFKDDDARLSFLQGNYITLTNMSDKDIDRIIRYRLEPINISFHTTNPELRCRMLHNRFAGDALKKVDTLYEAGIEMNGQIVLCRDVNDKEELDRTIRDLTGYMPYLQSVSVVPVGMTKYREGLAPLVPFDKKSAIRTLELIHSWQDRIYEKTGRYFIQAGDEWYLLAEKPIPPKERYDGYLQLENGVGMLRLLMDEFEEGMRAENGDGRRRRISIATGRLAAPVIRRLTGQFQRAYPHVDVRVHAIENVFFGERITVSGLVTAQDLIGQLAGTDLGEQLLLPVNMLRASENVFLDDYTTEQVSEKLGVPLRFVQPGGQDLIDALKGETV